MGSSGGSLLRPLSAAAAFGVAAASSNLLDKLSYPQSFESSINAKPVDGSSADSLGKLNSWVHQISLSNVSNLSFSLRLWMYLDRIKYPTSDMRFSSAPIFMWSGFSANVTSPPILLDVYRSVDFSQFPPVTEGAPPPDSTSSEVSYRWHLPQLSGLGDSECSTEKSKTLVVLLGWLGAKQKHLKKYADWYTSMGFHVVTFTFPMSEILGYKVGGKAEENVDLLANHLASWVGEEHGKKLVFHTLVG